VHDALGFLNAATLNVENRVAPVTIHQLRIFESVARHLSFTGAARELDIAQPAVYLQIRSLEDSCRIKLYRKVGRQIVLTIEGARFRDELGQILPRIKELESGAGQTVDNHESLAIGGSHMLSAAVLAPALVAFKKTHPNVSVILRTKSSPGIERLVSASEIEIGLITQPQSSGGLVLEPFRRERMVIIVAPKHALARKPEISMAEFAQAAVIIRERQKSASRQLLDQVESQGFRLHNLMRFDTANAVKFAVMSGLGLGLIYREHVQNEIKTGRLKVIKVHGLKEKSVQSFIVYKPALPLTPIVVEFLEILHRRNRVTPWEQKLSSALTSSLKTHTA